MNNKQKALAAGAAFLLTAGVAVGAYLYGRGKKANAPAQSGAGDEERKQDEASANQNWLGFEDPDYGTNHYLKKVEAKSASPL